MDINFKSFSLLLKLNKHRIVVNPDENEENEEAEQTEDGQQNDHYHYMLMAMANQIMCMMLKIILLIFLAEKLEKQQLEAAIQMSLNDNHNTDFDEE